MFSDHWPLRDLRLVTPDLELRWPDEEELGMLGDVAAQGIHDPDFMPFLSPWTDVPPDQLARAVIQNFWSCAGAWQPDDWRLPLVVFHEGRPVGIQTVRAREYAITREVVTGSWLGLAHQGKGFGTQMRVAVLSLAFEGLDAVCAVSAALDGNHASKRVSHKLGYRDDGTGTVVVLGKRRTDHRLRLVREDWRAPYRVPIYGLDKCLKLFGL